MLHQQRNLFGVFNARPFSLPMQAWEKSRRRQQVQLVSARSCLHQTRLWEASNLLLAHPVVSVSPLLALCCASLCQSLAHRAPLRSGPLLCHSPVQLPLHDIFFTCKACRLRACPGKSLLLQSVQPSMLVVNLDLSTYFSFGHRAVLRCSASCFLSWCKACDIFSLGSS